MSGATARTTMTRTMAKPRPPRVRPTASQAGSIRFTPATVANRIGQIAAAAIRKTMAPSQVGKARMAMGIHDSGLIIRRI